MASPAQLLLVAVNHLLSRETWARQRLAPFAGESFSVSTGLIDFHYRIVDGGLLDAIDEAGDGGVVIQIDPQEFLHSPPFSHSALLGKLHITGNAALADALAFVASNLRWDAEADFSTYLGDIPARRLVMGFKSFIGGARQTLIGAAQNFHEFIVDEKQLVTSPSDIATFSQEVSALRDSVSRLEKRIERLLPSNK